MASQHAANSCSCVIEVCSAINITADTANHGFFILMMKSSLLPKICSDDYVLLDPTQVFIDLTTEPLESIATMIPFFRHVDYYCPWDLQDEECIVHIQMAIVAHKYNIPALKKAATTKVKLTLSDVSKEVSDDLFHETLAVAFENSTAIPEICDYLVDFALDHPEGGGRGHISLSLRSLMTKYPLLAIKIAEAVQSRLHQQQQKSKEREEKQEKKIQELENELQTLGATAIPPLDLRKSGSAIFNCPTCQLNRYFKDGVNQHSYYLCEKCGNGWFGRQWMENAPGAPAKATEDTSAAPNEGMEDTPAAPEKGTENAPAPPQKGFLAKWYPF